MKKWVLYLFIFIQCLHGLPTLTMETTTVDIKGNEKGVATEGKAPEPQDKRAPTAAELSKYRPETYQRLQASEQNRAKANQPQPTTAEQTQASLETQRQQYQEELVQLKQRPTPQELKSIIASKTSYEKAFNDEVRNTRDTIRNNKNVTANNLDNISLSIDGLISTYETIFQANPKFASFDTLQFIKWTDLSPYEQKEMANFIGQTNILDALQASLPDAGKSNFNLESGDQQKINAAKQWIIQEAKNKRINLDSLPLDAQMKIYTLLRTIPNEGVAYSRQFMTSFENLYTKNIQDINAAKKNTSSLTAGLVKDKLTKLQTDQQLIKSALTDNYKFLMSNYEFASKKELGTYAHRLAQIETGSLLALWDAGSKATGDNARALRSEFKYRFSSLMSFIQTFGSPFEWLMAMRAGMPAARTAMRAGRQDAANALEGLDNFTDFGINIQQVNHLNSYQNSLMYRSPLESGATITSGDYVEYGRWKLDLYSEYKKQLDTTIALRQNPPANYSPEKLAELSNEGAYQAYKMNNALNAANLGSRQARSAGYGSPDQLSRLEAAIEKAKGDLNDAKYNDYLNIGTELAADFKKRQQQELQDRLTQGNKNILPMEKAIEKSINAKLNMGKWKAADIIKIMFFLLPLFLAIIQLVTDEEEKNQIPGLSTKSHGSSPMFL